VGLRKWLVTFYAAITLVLVGVLAFSVVGIARPDLVFAWGGRLVPALGASAILVVLWLAITLVFMLRAMPPAPSAEMPWATEAQRASGRISRGLSSNVSAAQAAAVLVPFGVFAVLALGINMMNPGGINLMTTDTAGNVYIHEGDHLLVADTKGAILTDADVKSAGVFGGSVCDIHADEQGNVYFADGKNAKVTVTDRHGRLLRTLSLDGLNAPDMLVATATRGGKVYVVASHDVVSFDAQGTRQPVYTGDLRYPSGLDFLPNGDLVVADTDNRRVVVLANGEPSVVDLKSVRSDAGICYPTDLHTGPNGEIYTILRRRDPAVPPAYWRGKLYMASATAAPKPIPLSWQGRELDLLAFSVLPDGRVLFAPLGYDALFIANSEGRLAPWAPGQLGPRLEAMSRRDLFVSWGPTLCLTLGITFAILTFGVMLHGASREREGYMPQGSTAFPPQAPAAFPPPPRAEQPPASQQEMWR
jgi:hypothetical protein